MSDANHGNSEDEDCSEAATKSKNEGNKSSSNKSIIHTIFNNEVNGVISALHAEIFESDFPIVNDPDGWPKGILIAPFYGKLNGDSRYDSQKELEPMVGGTLKVV